MAAKFGWICNSKQAACPTKRFREVGFRLFCQHTSWKLALRRPIQLADHSRKRNREWQQKRHGSKLGAGWQSFVCAAK